MRHLLALFAMLTLACSTAPPVAQPGSTTAPVDDLLGMAASDFRAGGSPPAGFRDVRVGHVVTAEGARQYLLCGEYLSDDTWKAFATIKTDPYEQWLGDQAVSSCKRTTITWHDTGDLSASLQQRFDSLR